MFVLSRNLRAQFIRIAITTFFTMLILASPIYAQTETGQIIGKVFDPNGALVNGASVLVKSVATGAERTATTTNDGTYVVTNLQPGLYDVTVNTSGFAASTQRVQVTVGSRTTVDTTLSVSAVGGETVTVVASSGVEVNTQTQELADVVSGTQLRELPTITRNPYALVQLSGNAVNDSEVSNRGTGFSINGQRSASTNVLLDGGENVDTFSATVGQAVPLDSVMEFRVISSNFTAEYGRASGGIVNVTTRSGGNDFHGTLYEFNRTSRLASNTFENNARGIRKPIFTRNQFGYSIGGPILKNELFFFSNTEWTRVRSIATTSALVPTTQLIAASNARTQSIFTANTLETQINGPIVTVGQIKALFAPTTTGSFFNLPSSTPAFGTVNYSVPSDVGGGPPQNTYQTVARVDYNFSNNTQIFGRLALDKSAFLTGSNSSSPYQGYNTGADTFNQNYLGSLTHNFSPILISQTKLVYNRLNQLQPLGEKPASPSYYLRTSTTSFLGVNVALPGYLPFNPGLAIPFGGPQNLGQFYQDFNYSWGKHQLHMGGQYVYIQDNRTLGAFQNAVDYFGLTSSSQGLNNLVDGNLRRFQVAIDPQGKTLPGSPIQLPVQQPIFSRSNRYNEWAAYLNDSFRVHPRITLNLGVRYEYYGVQHNKDQQLDSNFYYGTGSSIFERIRNGGPQRAPDSPVGKLWNPDKNNFAPRLGFAWDLFGDGRTSLRGGYGIAYERNFGNVTFNIIQNPPAYAVVTVDAGSAGFPTIPVSTNNLGPLTGSSGTVALPGRVNIRHVDQNIQTAYAHFWSGAFEREILPNTVASVEYSGSAGRKLYDLTNPNRPGSACVFLNECASDPFGAGFPTGLLNPNFYPLNTRSNRGKSDYQALIASLESNDLAKLGLQFTARYSYASTKDNLSSTFSDSFNNVNLGVLDPFNPDIDYGYSDFDVRHRFVGSFNWALPFAKDKKGFARQAFGGWTVTGIVNARTGLPFNVYDCTNAAFEVCMRAEANGPVQFSGNGTGPDTGQPNLFNYINLSGLIAGQYVHPTQGTSEFGPYPADMIKRGGFRGPGYWNVDTGIYKTFRFGEKYSLQFRTELYNVFNHSNLYVVYTNTDISATSAVQVKKGFPNATINEQRNIQLAVKFIF